MKSIVRIALVVALASTIPPAVRAQQPVPPTALNGEWTGVLTLDNSQPRLALVFAITDSSFAGRVYSDGTLMGEMEDGSLSGNRLHFKLGRLDFTGVVTGVHMKVDLIVYNGSTRNFTLTKTPS
ncbi:MAG TPA: hypothetical protein VGJ18_23865 [Gemmatimonadaceae bacterium]|jgi:hypothetical protein